MKLNKVNHLDKRKTIIFILLSLLAISIIIFFWFKSAKIISDSEESLSIYNPAKTAEINISVWYPSGMGTPIPYGINRAYPFLVLSQLARVGIPAFLNQAILIGLVMLLTLFSAYILFNYLSRGLFFVAFFGAFFYLLNLYTQTQIFRRLLYNFMFALAYYPLFLYLWIKCLETKSWKYLILFSLSSVIFSFSFNQPATLIPFLLSAAIVFLIKLWQKRKSLQEISTIILFSIFSFFLVCLVNIWWVYPILVTNNDYISLISPIISADSNLKSLEAVSRSFPIHQILLLRQSFWYGPSQHWSDFYNNPLVYIISIVILLITILGLIKSKSSPFWPVLITLIGVGLFISKGTNFPFGHVFFNWLFNNFLYAAALRNPYEKFGIVFLLPYVFFFTFGLYYLLNKLKNNLRKMIFGVSFVIFIIILVWPMWSGNVFREDELIKIPSYYPQANNFLNKLDNLKIFHIPLNKYYNQSYEWGFYGQDPTEYLFDRTPLSYTFDAKMSAFYKRLPELANNRDFPKLLGFLGASNIVVHTDSINKSEDNLIDINTVSNWDGISKISDIGKLTVYQLDPELVRSHLYGIELINDNLEEYTKQIFPEPSILDDEFINFDYQKLSPTRYIVKVKDIRKPFILIFNEAFDSSWTAKIDSQIISNHFKVYGLVNGWLIDKEGIQTIEIKLKIWPWD